MTKKDAYLIEVKTYLDVAIQTMEIQSEDSIINSTTSIFEVNQEINRSMTRAKQFTKIPYRRPHHKRGYLN